MQVFFSLWIMPPINGTGLSEDETHFAWDREETAWGSKGLQVGVGEPSHHHHQKQAFQTPQL